MTERMFHQYTQQQLELLVESTQFNSLERKEMRELFLEMLSRLRSLEKRNKALELVAGKF